LRAYVKQAGESLDMQNSCAEIKIRAKRRIGEFSKKLDKKQGAHWKGKRDKTSHDGESINKIDILKDAGIKHHERYEAIAGNKQKSQAGTVYVCGEGNIKYIMLTQRA
jgi:hypothetical protein